MSVWNVRRKPRIETIIIAKILQRWSEYAAGLPGMEIFDTKKRRHAVAFIDLDCSLEEWEQIAEGRKIKLILRESVIYSRLLPSKARTKKTKQIEIPKSPYYRWTCLVCKKTDTVSYEGWEEPFKNGESILEAHKKVKPEWCESESFKIIDHTGQDRTEEFNQIMGFKPRISR
jgi:hypothetical protein